MVYVHLDYINKEVGRKHSCVFQENLTLLIWKSGCTNKYVCRIKENKAVVTVKIQMSLYLDCAMISMCCCKSLTTSECVTT